MTDEPRRAAGDEGWADGDRNGEPSEESDPPWDPSLVLAVMLIGALTILVLALIVMVASSFPSDRTYSTDRPSADVTSCEFDGDLPAA